MKIAYISQEYPPSLRSGGIASYIKEIALGMKGLGHEVTVITASDDTRKTSDVIENGIRVIRLKGGNFYIPQAEGGTAWLRYVKKFRCFYRFWSYRKRIRDAVKEFGPFDIIEVPEYGCEALYLNELTTPIVYRLHTASLMDHYKLQILPLTIKRIPIYIQGLLELKLIKEKAYYISSCSEAIKDWTEKVVLKKRQNIRTIYNPIKIQNREHITFNNKNNINIFYAGTICDWKGVGDLYETGKILEQRGCNFTITMAGKVGAFANTLQPQPWLNMLGMISRHEVMKRYSEADIVCFPSWWENMPMVCIEVMMCGALVIGSNSGGMSEIISDGENGFLLPPKHPKLWADKIIEVQELNVTRKQEISDKARQRIKENFSIEEISKKMEEFYMNIINQL